MRLHSLTSVKLMLEMLLRKDFFEVENLIGEKVLFISINICEKFDIKFDPLSFNKASPLIDLD